ncbi:MAG: radical SAM protein [Nanoarchaeota archaeon]
MDELNNKKCKILLVNPKTPILAQEPSRSLALIAGYLLNEGHIVKGIDCCAQYYKYNKTKFLEDVSNFNPDIVGIAIHTSSALYAYEAIRQIKRTSNALIVGGGPHALVRPHEVLKQNVDIVVQAEGEVVMADIVKAYQSKLRDYSKIKGICYLNKVGNLIDTEPADIIHDLNSLPDPAFDVFNLKDYEKPSDLKSMITGRGCPGRCTFCANTIHGHVFRFLSAEKVYAEMVNRYKKYGATHTSFLDDSFTANPERVRKLCNLIIINKDKYNFTFGCVTRANIVNEELLTLMKKAGCNSINYGIEGADDETLRKCKKGITIEQAIKALKITKAAGITAQANFILGFPWQSAKDIKNTLKFMKYVSQWADFIQVGSVLIPYPGTEIYEEYHQKYGFTDWWLKKEYSELLKKPRFMEIGIKYYNQHRILKLDYFKYPKETKREILKAIKWTAKYSASHMTKYYRFQLYVLYYLSRFFYLINPSLEQEATRLIRQFYFKILGFKKSTGKI